MVCSIDFLLILCSLVPLAWVLLLSPPTCSAGDNEGGGDVDGDEDDDNDDDGVT